MSIKGTMLCVLVSLTTIAVASGDKTAGTKFGVRYTATNILT